MHVRERGTRGRVLRTSTSYPKKPVVQPRGFGTRWLSPLEPYPFGGPGKHSRHFQIRLRHCCCRSSSATEPSSPEAPAHPPMQRSTAGRREECQGYCWYAAFRGPSTFLWQLNWLPSARGAMVPWGFATTVILRPVLLPPEVDLTCLQPGQETRSRQRQQLCPFVKVMEPGRNAKMSIHSEKLTHPRTPPQHAYCPGTWGSDRDHHPAPGNDRIQKRMGDTLSEARPNSSL